MEITIIILLGFIAGLLTNFKKKPKHIVVFFNAYHKSGYFTGCSTWTNDFSCINKLATAIREDLEKNKTEGIEVINKVIITGIVGLDKNQRVN